MSDRYRRNNDGNRQGGGGGRGNRDRRGVPLSDLDPALTEMSRSVIGCAIEVHKILGPGYEPDVYLKALCLALDGDIVGQTVATLYVGERFLVEVLARTGEVGSGERSKLRAQLRAADSELGLIINFGERRLKDGLVRVINLDKLQPQDEAEYEDDDASEEGGDDE